MPGNFLALLQIHYGFMLVKTRFFIRNEKACFVLSKWCKNEKNPVFVTGSSLKVLSDQQSVQKSPKEHLNTTCSTSPVAYASFLDRVRIVDRKSVV